MNKSRKLSLLNMFINLAVIVMSLLGIYYFVVNPLVTQQAIGPDMLKYYTVLTSIVTLLAAALMIWANIISFIKKKDCTPRLFYSMRYLSAVMSLLTLITVTAFIYPELKADPEYAGSAILVIFGLAGGSIFLHFLCPIISMIQFTCFEIEPKARFLKTLEPLIGTLLYAVGIIASMFAIQQTQGVEAAAKFAPYFFFWITPDLAKTGFDWAGYGGNYLVNIGIAVGVILIAYAAAILLWLLNRMFHAAFIGEEYQPITPTAKKTPSKKKGAPAPKKGNAFTSFVKRKVAFGDGTSSSGPVYHISYHDRSLRTWKVKAENAGRALKVFPTQKEAIAFANSCIKKSGGSIRVHSMMGRMRKE